MSLDSLKLPKQVLENLNTLGFTEPKEIQSKALSRINGGQEMILVGPEGCGKSTLLVMSVIAKLKYAFEVAPRALIMVSSKEKGMELESHFRNFGEGMDLRVVGFYPKVDEEEQREWLREGVDVAIGTPDKILALYIRSGINLTKLKMFVVDDTEEIIKLNQQVIIKNITDNLNKCQYILTTTEINPKIEKLGGYFFLNEVVIEVE